MTQFIQELETLKAKIAESQIYAEQSKQALLKAHELAENLHALYLADIKK